MKRLEPARKSTAFSTQSVAGAGTFSSRRRPGSGAVIFRGWCSFGAPGVAELRAPRTFGRPSRCLSMSESSVAPPLGTLVALGGGDDDAMLALLCDLLPGADTPVEIITAASWRNADPHRRRPTRSRCASWAAPAPATCPSASTTPPMRPPPCAACAGPASCFSAAATRSASPIF